MPAEQLDKVAADTMVGGATLTKLLGTSAWYAPGAAAAQVVAAVLGDRGSSAARLSSKASTAGDLCIGVPCISAATASRKIVEFDLNADEKALFGSQRRSRAQDQRCPRIIIPYTPDRTLMGGSGFSNRTTFPNMKIKITALAAMAASYACLLRRGAPKTPRAADAAATEQPAAETPAANAVLPAGNGESGYSLRCRHLAPEQSPTASRGRLQRRELRSVPPARSVMEEMAKKYADKATFVSVDVDKYGELMAAYDLGNAIPWCSSSSPTAHASTMGRRPAPGRQVRGPRGEKSEITACRLLRERPTGGAPVALIRMLLLLQIRIRS